MGCSTSAVAPSTEGLLLAEEVERARHAARAPGDYSVMVRTRSGGVALNVAHAETIAQLRLRIQGTTALGSIRSCRQILTFGGRELPLREGTLESLGIVAGSSIDLVEREDADDEEAVSRSTEIAVRILQRHGYGVGRGQKSFATIRTRRNGAGATRIGVASNAARWYEFWSLLQLDATDDSLASIEGNLDLSNQALFGSIPPGIGQLVNVAALSLKRNKLCGAIPKEVGDLTQLCYLSLASNQLTGPLPLELGQLTNLSALLLNDNQLCGEIPVELIRMRARGCRVDLQRNQPGFALSDGIGELGDGVTNLNLSFCCISGELPSELGVLSGLETLALPWNHLAGEIPNDLAKLTNLSALQLMRNRLSGPIPRDLCSHLTNLERLALSSNLLAGMIPPLGNLAKLVELDLSSNRLGGSLPPDLGKLRNLKTLNLFHNQICGPSLPGTLRLLVPLASTLEELDLGDNKLGGSITANVATFTKLRKLWLSAIEASGPLPVELGKLTMLQTLLLNGNQLTGAVPAELGNLANLELLELHVNLFSGGLPPVIGHLTQCPVPEAGRYTTRANTRAKDDEVRKSTR